MVPLSPRAIRVDILYRPLLCRDLDRDRRERRRDVRGVTTKHEPIKEKDRYVTQEDKAQRYKAVKAAGSGSGSGRKVVPSPAGGAGRRK